MFFRHCQTFTSGAHNQVYAQRGPHLLVRWLKVRISHSQGKNRIEQCIACTPPTHVLLPDSGWNKELTALLHE